MFPFRDGFTYPKNAWYVAAWSSDVKQGALMERWILGDPVVLYRARDGAPIALAGRCPHRRYPLANGKLLDDDRLQCGYHGFTFDRSGACVHIPSTDRVQPGMRVLSYPIVERWSWLWIWMGDPALADPALIPDHRTVLGVEDPGMTAAGGGYLQIGCRYQLLHENILDLTHLAFVHLGSLGSAQTAAGDVEIESEGRVIRVIRWTYAEEPTPLYVEALGVRGPIDRMHVTEFHAPSLHVVRVRVNPAGSSDGPFLEHRGLHAITPATPTTTHYHFGVTRDYARDAAAVTGVIQQGFHAAFLEDQEVLERQERMVASDPNPRPLELSVKADEGALKSRRLMESLIAAEMHPVTKA
jgi:vanillate O-demethylase monooxygenase subunit